MSALTERHTTPECVPRELGMSRVQRSFVGTIVAVAFAWQVVQLCLITPSLNDGGRKMRFHTDQHFKRIAYAKRTRSSVEAARDETRKVVQGLSSFLGRILTVFSAEGRATETGVTPPFLETSSSLS